MSHSTNARRNIHQRHPIVFFKYYLKNINEPRNIEPKALPEEFKPEYIKQNYLIRFPFRQLAQKLRKEKQQNNR